MVVYSFFKWIVEFCCLKKIIVQPLNTVFKLKKILKFFFSFLLNRQMTGMSTEDDIRFQNWTGKLNVTYRLGPGFQSPSLE